MRTLKGDSYYIMKKRLSELCPAILKKENLVSNEYGYLTEKIFKQSVKGST
jgi:hypothetical protein